MDTQKRSVLMTPTINDLQKIAKGDRSYHLQKLVTYLLYELWDDVPPQQTKQQLVEALAPSARGITSILSIEQTIDRVLNDYITQGNPLKTTSCLSTLDKLALRMNHFADWSNTTGFIPVEHQSSSSKRVA